MSKKSKLRQEYEAVFGVVEGGFSLYGASGKFIYSEDSDGESWRREYDAEGRVTYKEDSLNGVTLDKREIEKVERSELAEKLSKITDEQLDDLALVARLAGRDAIRKELQQIIEQ